jgi:glutathione-regulated potassium-efflux system protein KefB
MPASCPLASGPHLLAAAVVLFPSSSGWLGERPGYLAAGVVIGPWGAGFVSDVESVLHFAEFGVVLLLFLMDWSCSPPAWGAALLGVWLGGAQVLGTECCWAGQGSPSACRGRAALVAGLGLSLSSTAFALQLLSEKNELTTDHGRASFGILLFQDLAVIPLLARAADAGPGLGHVHRAGVGDGAQGRGRAGRRHPRGPVCHAAPLPLRRLAAHQELFTATALLVVVGTAVLVSAVGLSMALGAFLAGVLLADSEFPPRAGGGPGALQGPAAGPLLHGRGHVRPHRPARRAPLLVMGLVLGLVALKALALYALGRWRFKANEPALSLAIVISQGGEFAFVLFGLAWASASWSARPGGPAGWWW